MTYEEWLLCTDVPAMLAVLWEAHVDEDATFARRMHCYLLACCRRIWRLLPQEDSRRGIEVAERYLMGAATVEELQAVKWYVEGAAFNIDYNVNPESIQRWVEDVQSLPARGLAAMLSPPGDIVGVDARELLLKAAYFADLASNYPFSRVSSWAWTKYSLFLYADLFRKQFAFPFQGQAG